MVPNQIQNVFRVRFSQTNQNPTGTGTFQTLCTFCLTLIMSRVYPQFSLDCRHEQHCTESFLVLPRFLICCCEVDCISNSLQEFVNPDMVPFVLPSALYIAQEVSFILVYQMHHNSLKASKADYVEHVLPSLKPVMKMMEPIQILLIFMQVASVYIFLYSKSLSPENGPSPGENPSRGCSQRCSADGLQGPRVGSFSNTGTLPFHNTQFCRQ